MKEAIISFLNDLKFFLAIYTWSELWLALGAGVAVSAFWYVFALTLSLPNPARAIVAWTIILALAFLVPKALTSSSKKR